MLSQQNRWFRPLFAELTVTNIAHFATLAILTVHMVEALAFSAGETAFVLLLSSVGLRFSRVALAPFVDRFAPRSVICCALLLSILGYIGVGLSTTAFPVAISMLMVGIGYGLNGMLVTTLASYTQHNKGSFSTYALMNSGTNLAAAFAPLVSNWLRLEIDTFSPFFFSSLVLCISLLISLHIHADAPSPYRNLGFAAAIKPLLRRPEFFIALAIVALGWAVYTQKFAATPLFINTVLAHPGYVGLAVMINALIVLALSLPAAVFIRAYNISGRAVLVASFVLYALAYATLALSPTLTGLWAALATWSVAEALLMPQLNALVTEVTGSEHRLAGFSASAVAIGMGEAAGNAAGVALMGSVMLTGQAWICYACLAVCACLAAAGAWWCYTSPANTALESGATA